MLEEDLVLFAEEEVFLAVEVDFVDEEDEEFDEVVVTVFLLALLSALYWFIALQSQTIPNKTNMIPWTIQRYP